MIRYLRLVRPMLSPRTKARLRSAVAVATLLALLEAAGVALILPFVLVLQAAGNPSSQSTLIKDLERLLGTKDIHVLSIVLGAIVVGAFLVKGTLAIVYLRWSIGFVMQEEATTAANLLDRYLHAPYTFHLEHHSARLQQTMQNAVRLVFSQSMVSVVGAIGDALITLLIAIVLLIVNPIIALIGAIYFSLVAIVYQKVIRRRLDVASEGFYHEQRRSMLLTQQSLAAVKQVSIGHRQQHFVSAFLETRRGLALRERIVLIFNYLPRYYLESCLVLATAGMAGVIWAFEGHRHATAILGLYLVAGFRVLPSINRVLVAQAICRSAVPAAEELGRDLALPLGSDETNQNEQRLPSSTIEFRDVRFSYPSRESLVLDGISLRIEPGERIAIVGPSGSGKTTMVDILMGLLEPDDGLVLIGGKPLSEVRNAWQRSIGYVPQITTLIDDSLLANVAFGFNAEDVDETRVEGVLRQASLESLIESLPEGLETTVGENGVRLSGGQRQRLAIARALYLEPAVLVLDEATSQLDSETERQVTDTINSLQRDLTMIIVAHRLSTVRRADRLYFLYEGRIRASGTFDQLVDSSAEFAQLVRIAGDNLVAGATDRYDGLPGPEPVEAQVQSHPSM
jgi:ABC-type multidrug transport system fused ATPase/permease subunit